MTVRLKKDKGVVRITKSFFYLLWHAHANYNTALYHETSGFSRTGTPALKHIHHCRIAQYRLLPNPTSFLAIVTQKNTIIQHMGIKYMGINTLKECIAFSALFFPLILCFTVLTPETQGHSHWRFYPRSCQMSTAYQC